MIKPILLSISVLTAGSALAEGFIRTVAPDLAVTKISPNGRYVVSEVYGYVEVFDLQTGTKQDFYGDENMGIEYTFGQGNSISDTGIGVGSTTSNGNACVYIDGEWKSLPVNHPELTNLSQGITPDASRICGQVGNAPMATDVSEVMSVPCIWERQEDGSYSGPILLPCPEKDFTGRTPQYITALCISDDGRTVAGQVRDYSGMMIQPILYRQDDKGEWSYEMLYPELANPDGIVLPPDPGEAPQNAPDMRAFMTPAEIAAYEKALANWESEGSGDFTSYPNMEDFMSPAELKAFNEAAETYYKELEEWYKISEPFEEALDKIMEKAVVYLFNNVYLSPDGKVYGSTTVETVEDETSWTGLGSLYTPVLINTDGEKYTRLPHAEGLMLTCVTADYTAIANTDGIKRPKQAYIVPRGDGDWELLNLWLDRVDPEVGKWFTTEATHKVEMITSEEILVVEDYVCSGVAVCTPDMTLFASFSEVLWDSAISNYTESYIFSVDPSAGIHTVGTPEGDVENVVYYGIDGRQLPSAPESGLSIRRTFYSNGAVVSEKIAK